MSRLPILTGLELIKILERMGFKTIRQKGSHVFLKHQDNRTTIIPVHKGKDVDRALLRKILRDTEISPNEFKDILRKS
ncbi:type II toxin-antitoxin system HicA family toxin [bacterium]|nr:type II toxin-antitoxin system HicA family toxin [bacterium]MBU4602259.1 type II toxin-antitoxin system HicA family toxin [bacterium]